MKESKESEKKRSKKELHLQLFSIHGLIRGENLELGRDADTGGQTKYVVELLKALAKNPRVDRVDLLTRQVIDEKVDASYGEPEEEVAPGAYIIRIPCGPPRYLRKELLWPYMDSFVDMTLLHLRKIGRVPDWIHSHYADAGLVGARLSNLLEVPLVHTGHSLGRVKKQRLLDNGMKEKSIEKSYKITRRIEAEETTLDTASLVVASTRQEVNEQYEIYDNYQPENMAVLPPGTDLSCFSPPQEGDPQPPIGQEVYRFLQNPELPLILALSRADERKNIAGLVDAYAQTPGLRDKANLVVVAGNRDEISELDKGARKVLTDLLLQIDRHDLYGSIAYPKHHSPEDVPDLYRMAAKSGGLFVNPALTEPFGLTLIEAAASGLPMVATENGGPTEILENCHNGLLIDPLDTEAIGATLLDALSDRERWETWAERGIEGAHDHYTWTRHVNSYLELVEQKFARKARTKNWENAPKKSRPLPTMDRLIISDIDNTLLGDREGLDELLQLIDSAQDSIALGFGIATGRNLESAVKILEEWNVPIPHILITAVGSEIYYGRSLTPDRSWRRHIRFRWQPDRLREFFRDIPGLRLQPDEEQREFKISFFVDPDGFPGIRELKRRLRKKNLRAQLIYSHDEFLDVLPIRASKGEAVRFISLRWGIPIWRILTAGDSGNDRGMLEGEALSVVVGNRSPELETLEAEHPRIYFAEGEHARGVLEGIEHYNFMGTLQIPGETNGEDSDVNEET